MYRANYSVSRGVNCITGWHLDSGGGWGGGGGGGVDCWKRDGGVGATQLQETVSSSLVQLTMAQAMELIIAFTWQ